MALLAVFAAPAVATGEAEQGPTLGVALAEAGEDSIRWLPASAGPRPLPVHIATDWAAVERTAGVYDWSAYAPAISAIEKAGYRVVLSLSGSNPLYLPDGGMPSATEGESLEAWLGFVRSAVRAFAGEVEIIEIWDRRGEAPPPPSAAYAFLLKKSALAARAEARALGSEVRVAQLPVAPSELSWQQELWGADSAAYVDVVPLRLGAGVAPDRLVEEIAAFSRESLLHPPAAPLWAHVPTPPDAAPPGGLGAGVQALASGVAVVMVRPVGSDDERAAQVRWLQTVDGWLAGGYAPAPTGAWSFLDEQGNPQPSGDVLGRFLNGEDFSTLVLYSLPGPSGELPRDRLVVETTFARNARIVDPVTGGELRVGIAPAPGGRKGKSFRVSPGPLPQALLFEKAVSPDGFDLPPEEVETTRDRELTAEEIVARFQQVRREQDDALQRWTARARIEFHFSFAQAGGTVDVAIDSNYFWERGSQVEWEQTDYYVNGNRVTWKKIPELPLIQPEKVVTLPLDLTLDRTYVYRLVGAGRVRDREAYVLAFDPAGADDGSNLYRGRIWIDRESFALLKTSLIQDHLEAPVISNEEQDLFRVESGPGGREYWLLDAIDGQQIWTAGGRNLVVQRQVSFLSYDVNPPVAEFRKRREAAYASTNQMLRDTDQGFRYLERQADGTRTVKHETDTNQLFAAAGAFKDNSTDGVVPLGGVNWFDYNLAGRDIQLNVLFGGVLAFVNATKPDLFGRKIDASLDVAGVAIKFDDEVFSGDEELDLERIRTRPQNLNLRLGIPVGQFFKFTVAGGVTFRSYHEDRDAQELYDRIREDPADPRDLDFVLPQDHTLFTASLLAEYNRRGYSVSLRGAQSKRSDWEEWGLFDRTTDSFQGFDEDSGAYVAVGPPELYDSFRRWQLRAAKEWYLPRFQKVNASIDLLDGSDLDRFSRYQFSFLGDDRLSGFSGSGVRFDRGAILRAGYAFNLFEAIRFNAGVETARVERKDSALGSQSFTGLGLSGNVIGPWKTVISLNWGYALASDIPDLEGEQEFLLLIFKLF